MLKKSMKEFYVCHNPFLQFAEGYVGYICLATRPRFFAAVRIIDPSKEVSIAVGGHNLGFVYQGPEQKSALMFLIVNQYIDRPKNLKLDKLLKEAAQFYARYLGLEQSSKGKSGYALFDDYNALTPEMQIFHLPAQNKYLLSYPLGLKSFDTDDELFDYLEVQLQYRDVQLAEGKVNVIVLE
jgi:hypothetical protein